MKFYHSVCVCSSSRPFSACYTCLKLLDGLPQISGPQKMDCNNFSDPSEPYHAWILVSTNLLLLFLLSPIFSVTDVHVDHRPQPVISPRLKWNEVPSSAENIYFPPSPTMLAPIQMGLFTVFVFSSVVKSISVGPIWKLISYNADILPSDSTQEPDQLSGKTLYRSTAEISLRAAHQNTKKSVC